MPKPVRQFVCNQCGAVQPKWMGKCPDCGSWDSLAERFDEPTSTDRHRPAETYSEGADADPIAIDDLRDSTPLPRHGSGIAELDRVLGGGLVPASAVLVGGDPGIGKSTLLLQAARCWMQAGLTVLYVTSEESVRQVQLRAGRLLSASSSQPSTPNSQLLVSALSNVERIRQHIRKCQPDVVVVDSIQLVYKPDLPAAPGSVSQLRASATELVWQAKQLGHAVLFVGHVTKDGQIAGPKLLEHLVDCVLYLEGERFVSHRLLRAVKNRFGPTHEVGVFEMTSGGLAGVADPSAAWLEQHGVQSGAVILPMVEGSRVLLVEVQALTARGVPGLAKRKVSGADPGRVAMILAVLERRAKLPLYDRDVFVNVVGGVKVTEPAADLAIALAIAGSMHDTALPVGTAVAGELGLGGEVRGVNLLALRVAEAARLGFKHFIGPSARALHLPGTYRPCTRIDQAMEMLSQI